MLHSDDADINKVIREIIELDKKAIRIKKNAAEMAEKILENTKKEMKEQERLEIENAQGFAQKNYEKEIGKARDERLAIIKAEEQEILKIREKYDAEKEEKALLVLKKLFNP